MEMTAEQLISFLGALGVGVVTAVVSVRLALRRFRSERWWERKTDAYSALFLGLFNVQRSLLHEVRRVEEGFKPSEEYSRELHDRARAGYLEIRQAAVLGTFFFSDDTAARLDLLVDQLDDPGYNLDLYEQVSADLAAVSSALTDLKSLAKRDLAVS
jgi:hypothetical protein